MRAAIQRPSGDQRGLKRLSEPGTLVDLAGVEMQDVEGAGSVLLPHEVVHAAEDERLAVGCPGWVGGVAGLAKERLQVVALGADHINLPGFSRLAGHQGEVLAIGRPPGEEDIEAIGSELKFFIAVRARPP